MSNQYEAITDEFTEVLQALSKKEDTQGFDTEAGQSWYYPTNYPLRDYQYSIIQESLYKNTLVSLPTGLGKTFIAAVVMYNFYRWYPSGKIIFMAPTRPLVKQQIDACYNIMPIPKNVTAELTGSKQQARRKSIWNEKRVFFITPQILQNDLEIIEQLGSFIKCLVFDEAHRAKGNHAYCEVIRKIFPKNKYFRVLALSATPGSNIKDVYEVINNLLIAHLEVKTEESPDVAPYVFQRSLQTIVVPLCGKLQEIRDKYVKVLERYTRILIKNGIVSGNCSQLTKGKIFLTMKSYQEKNRTNRGPAHSEIIRCLNICITLYHAYELLLRHGLRGFLSFFEDHINKPLFRGIQEIHDIMEEIRIFLGPVPNVEPLPDGSVPDVPETVTFGHPKYYELNKILQNHFLNSENTNSRVIVFCEYKESVMEAYTILLQNRPVIKPKYFMGQGAMVQRQQLSVIKSFREGECNTLISTCIGEEGLDVGEVDLIVCFDINNKSPIRLVQRMGRTGRKRAGKVIILVSQGKEQQVLKECLAEKSTLPNRIMTSKELRNGLFKNNPRMVPEDIIPSCQKIYMTVTTISPVTTDRKVDKNENDNVEIASSSFKVSEIQDKSILKKNNRIIGKEILQSSQRNDNDKGAKKGKALRKGKSKANASDNFKQCNLLNMFSNELAKKTIKELGVQDDYCEVIEIIDSPVSSPVVEEKTLTEEFISEISDFVSINEPKYECKVCDSFFDCNNLQKTNKINSNYDFNNWIDLDEEVLKTINSTSLSKFVESLNHKKYNFYNDFDMADCVNSTWNNISLLNKSVVNNMKFSQKTCCIALQCNSALDLQDFLDDSFKFKLELTGKELTNEKTKDLTDEETKTINSPTSNETIFKLQDRKDVCTNDNSFNYVNKKNCLTKANFQSKENSQSFVQYKQALDFFHLETLEKLFKHLNQNCNEETVYDLDDITIVDEYENREKSPILSAYERIQSFKLKTQDKISLTQSSKSESIRYSNEFNSSKETLNLNSPIFLKHKLVSKNKSATSSNSSDFGNVLTINEKEKNAKLNSSSQITNIPNENKNCSKNLELFIDLDNFCDMSLFEPNSVTETCKNQTIEKQKVCAENTNILNISSNVAPKKIDQRLDEYPKEKTNSDEISPIISQFKKTCYNTTLPSQLSITQAINIINKKKQKTVSSILKDLNSDDFCDEFCFEDTKRKPTTPITKANLTGSSVLKDLDSNDFSDEFCFEETRKNPTLATTPTTNIVINPSTSDMKSSSFINVKNKRKSKCAMKKALLFDSDDDFEEPSSKLGNNGWLSKNSSCVQNHGKENVNTILNSEKLDCRFIRPFSPIKKTSKNETTKRKRKKKRNIQNCSFINQEAELESGDEISSDTTEGSNDDIFDASFVNDETQDIADNTVIHAQYLKSVKSPILNRGQFKIPENPPMRMDVYSQTPNTEDNSYLNDSFCDDDIHYLTQKDEMSVLELAELKLEMERKEKKRKKYKDGKPQIIKKRRIIYISSDDSD